MRSYGRTTVSRTRARTDSVRRRRRGRRVSAARAAVSVVGSEIVFVVIDFSVVELHRAGLRAEAAPHRLVRAVGAEPLAADDATIEAEGLFGVSASGTAPIFGQGHGSRPALSPRRREIVGP